MKRFTTSIFPVLSILTLSITLSVVAQGTKPDAFRAATHDPFSDPTALRSTKRGFVPAQYPSLEVRETEWRKKRSDHAAKGLTLPSESEKYLVSEIESVSGLFVKGQVLGAFLKFQNRPTRVFVKAGEMLYNGSVLSIEKLKAGDAGESGLIGRVTCSEIFRDIGDDKIIQQKQVSFVAQTPRH